MSESTLKETIQEQMKDAMRARDKENLGVIRLILAAVKQVEVDERKTLTDGDIFSLLDKMIKQRKDSIKQFETANRDDLIAIETFEIKVIQRFLPEPLSESEILSIINEAIDQVNPNGMQDMGKIIGQVRGKVQGRADMGQVSQLVKNALTKQS